VEARTKSATVSLWIYQTDDRPTFPTANFPAKSLKSGNKVRPTATCQAERAGPCAALLVYISSNDSGFLSL
jgi:hypothetical protein